MTSYFIRDSLSQIKVNLILNLFNKYLENNEINTAEAHQILTAYYIMHRGLFFDFLAQEDIERLEAMCKNDNSKSSRLHKNFLNNLSLLCNTQLISEYYLKGIYAPVDIFCPEYNLVIQVDGPTHYYHGSSNQNNKITFRTKLNTKILELAGYIVKRISYKDLDQDKEGDLLSEVIQMIESIKPANSHEESSRKRGGDAKDDGIEKGNAIEIFFMYNHKETLEYFNRVHNETVQSYMYFRALNYIAALPLAEEVLKIEPNNTYILLDAGLNCSRLKDFNKALGYLELITSMESDQVLISYALFNIGAILCVNNKHKEALGYFNRIQDNTVGSAIILRSKALSYYYLEMYNESKKCFGALIEMNEFLLESYLHLAYIFEYENNDKKALAYYDIAFRYANDNIIHSKILFNKARIHAKNHNYGLAKDFFIQASLTDPKNIEAEIQEGNITRTIESLNRIRVYETQKNSASLENISKDDKVLEYEAATKTITENNLISADIPRSYHDNIDPNHTDALYNQGHILKQILAPKEQVIEHFEKIFTLEPEHKEAQEAINKLIKREVEANPAQDITLNDSSFTNKSSSGESYILFTQSHQNPQFGNHKFVLKTEAYNLHSYFRKGIDSFIERDFQNAIEYFFSCSKLAKDPMLRFDSLCNTGACYANISDHAKALEFYEYALEIYPNNHFALFYKAILSNKLRQDHQDIYDDINIQGLNLPGIMSNNRLDKKFELSYYGAPYYPPINNPMQPAPLFNPILDYKSLRASGYIMDYYCEEGDNEYIATSTSQNQEYKERSKEEYSIPPSSLKKTIRFAEKPEARFIPSVSKKTSISIPNKKSSNSSSYHDNQVNLTKTDLEWGHECIALKKYSQAVEFFGRALKSNPSNIEALYYMSCAYYSLENYPQALESLNKILDIDSNHINALYNKGLILDNNFAKKEQAIECFKKILALEPEHEKALKSINKLMALEVEANPAQDKTEVELTNINSETEQNTLNNPKESSEIAGSSDTLEDSIAKENSELPEDKKSAEMDLQKKSKKQNGEDDGNSTNAAEIYLKEELYKESKEYTPESELKLDPIAQDEIASSKVRTLELESLAEQLKQKLSGKTADVSQVGTLIEISTNIKAAAAKEKPKKNNIKNQTKKESTEHQKIESSLCRNTDQKTSENSSHAAPLCKKGFKSIKSGNYKEALRYFNEIIQIKPSHVKALYGKAIALEHENTEEAIKCLERALELDANYPGAQELINKLRARKQNGEDEGNSTNTGEIYFQEDEKEEGWQESKEYTPESELKLDSIAQDEIASSQAKTLEPELAEEKVGEKNIVATEEVTQDINSEIAISSTIKPKTKKKKHKKKKAKDHAEEKTEHPSKISEEESLDQEKIDKSIINYQDQITSDADIISEQESGDRSTQPTDHMQNLLSPDNYIKKFYDLCSNHLDNGQPHKAERLLKVALKGDSDSAALEGDSDSFGLNHLLMKALYQSCKYDEAINEGQFLINRVNKDYDKLSPLGIIYSCYQAKKDYKNARDIISSILNIFDNLNLEEYSPEEQDELKQDRATYAQELSNLEKAIPEDLRSKAEEHFKKSEFTKAKEILASFLENEMTQSDHYHLGYILYEEGDLKNALAHLSKAIKIKGEYTAKVFFAVGKIYFSNSQYNHAKTYLTKSLNIEKSQNKISEIQEWIEKVESKLAIKAKAPTLNTKEQGEMSDIGEVQNLPEKSIIEGKKASRKVLSEDINSIEGRMNLARDLFNEGKYDEAIKEAEMAIYQHSSEHPHLLEIIAASWEAKKDYQKAYEIYSKILSLYHYGEKDDYDEKTLNFIESIKSDLSNVQEHLYTEEEKKKREEVILDASATKENISKDESDSSARRYEEDAFVLPEESLGKTSDISEYSEKAPKKEEVVELLETKIEDADYFSQSKKLPQDLNEKENLLEQNTNQQLNQTNLAKSEKKVKQNILDALKLGELGDAKHRVSNLETAISMIDKAIDDLETQQKEQLFNILTKLKNSTHKALLKDIDPSDTPKLMFYLTELKGILFAKANQCQKAEEICEYLLDTNYDATNICSYLMTALYSNGKTDEAIILGEKVISKGSPASEIQAMIGILYMGKKEYEQAYKSFELTLPQCQNPQTKLRIQDYMREALEELNKAKKENLNTSNNSECFEAKKSGNSPDDDFHLGATLYAKGNLTGAYSLLKQAIENKSTHTKEACFLIGQIFYYNNQYKDAKKYFQKALKREHNESQISEIQQWIEKVESKLAVKAEAHALNAKEGAEISEIEEVQNIPQTTMELENVENTPSISKVASLGGCVESNGLIEEEHSQDSSLFENPVIGADCTSQDLI
ncbi:MAG: tetratricopeptide repeat protein [Rickettsiaceae bacterium]|nr:tetratricopeptide repeat protein [Rickettsiaceae bacterium]